jgi:hypothetical protein
LVLLRGRWNAQKTQAARNGCAILQGADSFSGQRGAASDHCAQGEAGFSGDKGTAVLSASLWHPLRVRDDPRKGIIVRKKEPPSENLT